ncbi:hypothetical protein DV704_10530 [Meiothermus sp. QL-1]|uniref:hypothetical protein n=1 Tax=Meiothermus sp. QL-1 TaxID=2058095 RepID=UPI000E0C29BA|nr:hypothetical protein [Meiothermus sp. QL-1]RDI94728.1 hypothetical protein DV704_10530 [Meiothermus sp. QL-1]
MPPFILLLTPKPPPGPFQPWGQGWGIYPNLEIPPENPYPAEARFVELLGAYSKELACGALGGVDLGEALHLWAFDRGELIFYYDSNPMYLNCPVCSYNEEGRGVEMRGVEALAGLFGATPSRALRTWLLRRKGLGFSQEAERLRQVLALLGYPPPPIVPGFPAS